MRRSLAAALVLALALPAHAGDMKSCASFTWPVDAERSAFADAGIAKLSSGASPGAFSERAFEFKLEPAKGVAFVVPPGGKPKAEGKEPFGGLATFAAPSKAGLYQVTISGEGWIDVIQGGKALAAAAHTGAKECPGLRKSVRFALEAAPVVLQISGAATDTIKVAVRPVE